eukprot:COSAG01_NODE_19456_length_1008_cov_2.818482_1_plen_196_part_00
MPCVAVRCAAAAGCWRLPPHAVRARYTVWYSTLGSRILFIEPLSNIEPLSGDSPPAAHSSKLCQRSLLPRFKESGFPRQSSNRHSRLDLEGRAAAAAGREAREQQQQAGRQGPAAAAVRRTGRRGLPRESRTAAPPDGRAIQLRAAGGGAAARARRAGAVSCGVSCAAPGPRARGGRAAATPDTHILYYYNIIIL